MNPPVYGDTLPLALALVIVPWLYLLTGWILAAIIPRSWAPAAATVPLSGLVFWCVVGVVRLACAGGALWSLGAVMLLLAGAGLRWRRLVEVVHDWRSWHRAWWAAYGLLVIALIVSPFPGLWLLGGDWLQHSTMAHAVHVGSFGADLLARSPFFAAGAAPCFDLGGRLGAFQLFNATAAAAAWLPLLARTLRDDGVSRPVRLAAWLALALSPFLTVNLQNLWPKFFAGGCMVVSLYQIGSRDAAKPNGLWTSGVWFAFAILAHESSVLYLPFWLIVAVNGGARWGVVRLMASLALSGAMVGLWQGWTIWRFGWEARVAMNPAVTYAAEISLIEKFGLNMWRLLCGSIWWEIAEFWRSAKAGLPERMYYTVVAGLTALGATALGIASIWLAAGRRAWWLTVKTSLATSRGRWLALGASLTVLLYLLLLGGVANGVGAVSGGLIPLAMWVAGEFIARLESENAKAIRRVLLGWLLVGWLPYVGVGAAVGTLLNWPEPFAAKIAQMVTYDDDLAVIFRAKFTPLGMSRLLWLAGLAGAAGVVCWAWVAARRLVTPVPGIAENTLRSAR